MIASEKQSLNMAKLDLEELKNAILPMIANMNDTEASNIFGMPVYGLSYTLQRAEELTQLIVPGPKHHNNKENKKYWNELGMIRHHLRKKLEEYTAKK